jgi:lipopolysaccharide export system protein LptA
VELLNDSAGSFANRPAQLTASGNVMVKSQQQENLRTLKTSALQIQFSPSAHGRATLKSAETLAPGEVELLSGTEKTTVAADRFFATFDAGGQLDLLRGENGVTMDRVSTAAMQDHKSAGHAPASGGGRDRSLAKTPGGEESSAPQRITARELTVHYSGGNWTEMEARGNVRFHQADRSGAAGAARFTQATDTIRLEDSAQVGDANSLTTATGIQLNQSTGEVTATGRVFTVENSSRDENSRALNASMGNGPVQISADRLEGNSRSGKATYMGHARLWQDDAIVEADTISLDRNAEQLDAIEDVRAQLPQKENAGTSSASGELRAARKNEASDTGRKSSESAANRAAARSTGPAVWMIRAPHLSYSGKDGRVHFETGVSAESSQGKMESRTLDVFMKSGNGGQRGVDHALAEGSVVIQQPGRRGTAERGEYFAEDERYVLSGGQPKLVDDIRGTTTGRSLTYFAGSDTILVDARGGSRTLTEHRIEK